MPDGSEHETLLRDGEHTEVATDGDPLVRVRRIGRQHVRVELSPAPEKVRKERLRIVWSGKRALLERL